MHQISGVDEPEIREFHGSQVADVEEVAGVYAWYYVPDVSRKSILEKTLPVIESFVREERTARLQISDLYRMELVGDAVLSRLPLSNDSMSDVVSSLISRSPFVQSLVLSQTFITRFCRPIYIGLSKSLRTRVYETHYLDLDSYWDPSSPVSKTLASSRSPLSVNDVADALGTRHSFALEARVRGIRTRDLLLQVLYIRDGSLDAFAEDSVPLREIERLLHLLSFPVCGRI